MYELIQVSENTYYVECPSKIGIVKLNDTEVCLIDSGSDKDAGRRVLKILNSNGWKLKSIYNTHSHADHIGANKYLEEQTGCKIYAPGAECCFTKHTLFESAFLYGGYPFDALRGKFLLAKESHALPLAKENLEDGFEIINLPGHFFDMVGYKTPDGIVFLADALCSRVTLDKYKIGFIYDVKAYLETLESIKNLSAKLFIPSHAEPAENISQLADYNIECVSAIKERILAILSTPRCFEEILKLIFYGYGLTLTCEQYVLVGSTLRSYLSWLKDSGVVDVKIENNMLLWEKTDGNN